MKLSHPIGVDAEERALRYLKKQGLQLVERNWHCKGGEIDLVMRDALAWVFIEVRHRASQRFGGALESLQTAKLRRIEHAVLMYITHNQIDAPCRIDAILSEGSQPLQWLKNIIHS